MRNKVNIEVFHKLL